jgi:hypothetical protein
MRRLVPNTLGFPSILLAAPLQAGCGSRVPEGPGEPALAAPEAVDVHSPIEVQRVQAFLDSRYTAADVRHSFTTKFAETIDCIDFYAQPGVKALVARGVPIEKIPTVSPNAAANPGPLSDVMFNGDPDESGRPRRARQGPFRRSDSPSRTSRASAVSTCKAIAGP